MMKTRIGIMLKIGIAGASIVWTAVLTAAPLVVGITDPTASEFDVKWDSCYAECVRKGGHSPVLLFYDDDTNRLAAAVSRIDVLLVTGGSDIEPARYGAKPSPKLGRTNPPRDVFDFTVLELARRRGIPILAICRGCQALNVFFGGTLWQDLPSERGTKLHGDGAPAHDIEIEAKSFLATALGGGRQKVNSYHHQAVRDVAPGFRVTAWSDDGVVEAIEGISYPAVGVQFHPEIMASEKGAAAYKSICRPEMVRLFGRMEDLVRKDKDDEKMMKREFPVTKRQSIGRTDCR